MENSFNNSSQTNLPGLKAFLLMGELVLVAIILVNSSEQASAFTFSVYPERNKAFTQSLNGNWSFKYIPKLDAGADAGFHNPNFNVSEWKTIPVPSNWELHGFAEPSYALELKDGMGLYRRNFRIPAQWRDNRRVALRFEGVLYGFEVWINGKNIGSSRASAYNPSTFDITEALSTNPEADNIIAVQVTTKPLGFEFDVNDDWALSGIFRDVTIFSVPNTFIEDIATSTKIGVNDSADLSIAVKLNQSEGQLQGKLLAPDGKIVRQFELTKQTGNRFESVVRVAKPQLWTAETPALYRIQLTLTFKGKLLQTVEERIGLREISIVDGVLKLNGKPIKLRGVNHHDIDPISGRAITESQMRRDLELMKKGNINFVRTSHYPPNKRFIELCDEMGIYVMDEVSIGKGEEHLEKPEYRGNILARVEPTITRDKNRPSVIVWSIGNENPVTEVELEAGRIAKQLDPTRPICYPKVGTYFAENYQRIPEFVDIYAPHYPTNSMLQDWVQKLKRPVILTEYAHALGLATDRIQDQWEILQATPQFAGGAIWHFQDQGILRKSATPLDLNKTIVYVWLDKSRNYDTHSNDGTDGIVYSDRRPQTDFWQVRKVYSPVQIKESYAEVKPGHQQIALTIENRHDFRTLRDFKLVWSLQRNGFKLKQGVVQLSAPPHDRENVSIPLTIPPEAGGNVLALNLRVIDEKATEITERTLRLDLPQSKRDTWLEGLSTAGTPKVSESQNEVKIETPAWLLRVDRSTGALTIHNQNGKELVKGIYPHSGRNLTMAEARTARSAGTWSSLTLNKIETPEIKVTQQDSKVLLSVSGRYPRPGETGQGLVGGYQAEFTSKGTIVISYDYVPTNAKGLLTEAGLSLVLPANLTELRWVGQGPFAGYPGKDRLNEFGLFHLNREDLRFQGNRRGTELAVMTAPSGLGLALIPNIAGDVAVDRLNNGTLFSHNAKMSSLGNKGTPPEIVIDSAKNPHISGSFTLVPLENEWKPVLTLLFGKPTAAKKVIRPFYQSYDQQSGQ